jgi:hypothetical protein
MASNFMIQHCRRKNQLHLKLSGDFDGSSAFELNDCLQKALKHKNRIIIHTDRLKSLPMFGCEMFHKQFGLRARAAQRVLFTGAYAPRIAPDGCPTQR